MIKDVVEVGGGGGRDDAAQLERDNDQSAGPHARVAYAHGPCVKNALPRLTVIATWSSVRPGIASPSAQLCVQFLSFTRYLLNRASTPRVSTSSPRSTGLDICCTSTTAAKAFAVGLMRIGLERLDLDAKNTKADDLAYP